MPLPRCLGLSCRCRVPCTTQRLCSPSPETRPWGRPGAVRAGAQTPPRTPLQLRLLVSRDLKHARPGSWCPTAGASREPGRRGEGPVQRKAKDTQGRHTAKLSPGMRPVAASPRDGEETQGTICRLFSKPSCPASQYGKQVTAGLTCWGRRPAACATCNPRAVSEMASQWGLGPCPLPPCVPLLAKSSPVPARCLSTMQTRALF